jgi:hypothetical protein
VDSKEVYGRSFGYIFLCRKCDAYVGVHKSGHMEGLPLGTLANAETRKARRQAHEFFDPLWEAKIEREECSKRSARNKAYKWLADQLGIEKKDCHISMFQKEECERVVEICSPYYRKTCQ